MAGSAATNRPLRPPAPAAAAWIILFSCYDRQRLDTGFCHPFHTKVGGANLRTERHAEDWCAGKGRRQELDDAVAKDGAKHGCPKSEAGLQPYSDGNYQFHSYSIGIWYR